MRRRIVMFITTLALSTIMLAGCGNDKTNNSVTSSATPEPEATEGTVVNEDDNNYDESDMTGDGGVVGDVVDDAADVVDDVADDTADVVDDATGNQGTDGTANNAGQSAAENNNTTTTDKNAATAKPANKSNKKNSKKTNNNKNNNNTKNNNNNTNKNR